jgi:fumarate reductase flavoprotein subunit
MMSNRQEADVKEVDVLVIGAGLAGLQCAGTVLETRPALQVCVLESQEQVGGSCRWAVGSFTAGGTKWQSPRIDDSPDAHYRQVLDMCEVGGGTDTEVERNKELLRQMCESAPAALDALESHRVVLAGPFLEAPHAVPRMHNAVPRASAVTEALADVVRLRGGTIRTGAEADVFAIERPADGAHGFLVRSRGEVHSARVVVIASGDLSATHDVVPSVNPGALGVPVRVAAERFGARAHDPHFAPSLRTSSDRTAFVSPTEDLVRMGTISTSAGHRVGGGQALAQLEDFTGQDLHLDVPRKAVPDGMSLCTYPAKGYGTARDLLADGLAVEATGEAGEPVLRIGPMRVVITLADGGLDVNRSMQVLNSTGAPIENLYACGSAALGAIRLIGHGHHLMWAAVTGTAAAHAVVAAS